MHRDIEKCFLKAKIEYFAALSYNECSEIGAHIIKKIGFEPKSVFVFLIPYYAGETVNISRYAASYDYHILIKKLTAAVISDMKELFPDNSFCGFGDHSPIDERSAAFSAGLGILGDNGLVINEKYGSYVFIADIISDLEPEVAGAVNPMPIKKCEGCGACRLACPGKILTDPGGMCLSYVTQKKGELADEEIALIKSTGIVWGCDECQTVCPHNKNVPLTPIPFFHEDRIERLDTKTLDALSDEAFSVRAFSWRGRKTVKRNLDILGI